MARRKANYIIGIDEVGRGSLAGPVFVAATALLKVSNIKYQVLGVLLKDSKKLTPHQREIWFEYIKNHPKIFYAIASVSPKIIDKINISQAANLAATRAFKKLTKNSRLRRWLPACRQAGGGQVKPKIRNYRVFLDGGLYIKEQKISAKGGSLPVRQAGASGGKNYKIKTIIKGDEKFPAIAMASIIAKVSRDKRMRQLHKKYPQYDFINNVGYGTKKHIKAIRKFGPSLIHRKSFKIR